MRQISKTRKDIDVHTDSVFFILSFFVTILFLFFPPFFPFVLPSFLVSFLSFFFSGKDNTEGGQNTKKLEKGRNEKKKMSPGIR